MYRNLRLFSLPFLAVGLVFLAVSAVLFVVNVRAGIRLSAEFIIPLIISLPFVVAGIVMFATSHSRIVRRRRLEESGVRIIADVVEIYHDTSWRINGRHPWAIHAQTRDERGNLTEYRETIGMELPPLAVGQPVVVAIDRNNPSSYAIIPHEPVESVRPGFALPQAQPWQQNPPRPNTVQTIETDATNRSGSAWDGQEKRNNGPFYSE